MPVSEALARTRPARASSSSRAKQILNSCSLFCGAASPRSQLETFFLRASASFGPAGCPSMPSSRVLSRSASPSPGLTERSTSAKER
ncbi:MAG: hypothetical protein ACLUEK_05410 [Oscillospiraceae bacterium]